MEKKSVKDNIQSSLKLNIPIVTDDEKLIPSYHSRWASGCDLRANVNEDFVIAPHAWASVPTGIRIEIPVGYEGQVRPRSGLSLRHGITVLNNPGTIDADYRDELQVILINFGKEPFTISRYDRIAQLVLSRISQSFFVMHNSLGITERKGGFGSTGME